MTISAIVALILALIIAAVSFLLQFMLTNITDGLKETIKELTTELKSLGVKVDVLSEKYAAAAVRTENTASEVERFRDRLHELGGIVMELQVTQKKCRHCRGE